MDDPHLQQVAAWMVKLADNPLTSGSKGYAAHRLAELMREPMYARLPEYIAEVRRAERGTSVAAEREPLLAGSARPRGDRER